MLKVLRKQTKIKLSISLLFAILIFGLSSNSLAMDSCSYEAIKNPLARYCKVALIGSKLFPPLYRSIKNMFSANSEVLNLVQELYGDGDIFIPDQNQNQDVIIRNVGVTELNHTTTTIDSTAGVDEDAEESTDEYEAPDQFFGAYSGTIPDELMLHIFSYLTPKELADSADVCRGWSRIANDNTAWMIRAREDFGEVTIREFIKNNISQDAAVGLDWKKMYALIACHIKYYTGLISNSDDFSQVQRAFSLAQDRGLFNADIYAAYIEAIGKFNNFAKAQRAFDLAQEYNLINVDICRAYIGAARRADNLKEARRVFDLAEEKGLISYALYVDYIRTVLISENFPEAQLAFGLAQKRNLVNVDTCLAYIHVASMCDDMVEAQRIFNFAQEKGLVDATFYATYIAMCGLGVINLGDETILVSIRYAANLKEIRRVFNLAYERGSVNIEIYTIYLEIISAAGDRDEAERVYKLAMAEELTEQDIYLLDRARSLADFIE